MAIPYFQARHLIEKNGIAVFSSNYHLYGDMSWRVMETLRMLVGEGHLRLHWRSPHQDTRQTGQPPRQKRQEDFRLHQHSGHGGRTSRRHAANAGR
jgi:hypothetical protein